MLKIEEFLDIEAIEKLRLQYLKCGLDDYDNFSLHYALFDNGLLCGCGRLFRDRKNPDRIIIDKISLVVYNEMHYEMIFRSLLLKCYYINCNTVYAKNERTDDLFYQKFNMKENGGFYFAPKSEIVFPKECKK